MDGEVVLSTDKVLAGNTQLWRIAKTLLEMLNDRVCRG